MADLAQLLKQAAPVTHTPLETDEVWRVGRRRRRAMHASITAGTLGVVGLVAIGISGIVGGPGVPDVAGLSGLDQPTTTGSLGDASWETLTDQTITSVKQTSVGDVWTSIPLAGDLDLDGVWNGRSVRGQIAVAPSGDVAVALSDRVLVFDPSARGYRTVLLSSTEPRALAIDDAGTIWTVVGTEGALRLEVVTPDDDRVSHPITPADFTDPDLKVSGADVFLVQDPQTESARSILVGSDGELLEQARSPEILDGVPGGWRVEVGYAAQPGGVLNIGANNLWNVHVLKDAGAVGLELGMGSRTESSVTTLGLETDGTWLGGLTVAGTGCPMWLVTMPIDARLPAATCALDESLEAATRGFFPYTVSSTNDLWWLDVSEAATGTRSLQIRRLNFPTT